MELVYDIFFLFFDIEYMENVVTNITNMLGIILKKIQNMGTYT